MAHGAYPYYYGGLHGRFVNPYFGYP